MQEIDVLYFYEYAARELDVACAVKAIAEQHYGLKIHIEQHPHGELASDLTRFRPRIVAFPHLASPFVPYVLEWPQAVYVNLMWEQILYKGNLKAKLPHGEFPIRHAMHLLWSDKLVDTLRAIGVPAGNIFVNGNLAYALYDEPYRRFYDWRAELARQHHLDPAKRWVFFPENYNWAFYTDSQMQTLITSGQTADGVQAMREFCLRSFDEAMKWCGALARDDSVEIILRPRPGTPLADFRQAVGQVLSLLPERIHIIKDESVREWIIASDSVVSSYSTSLIERAVAGKLSFILAPYPIPESIHMEWHDHTPHI